MNLCDIRMIFSEKSQIRWFSASAATSVAIECAADKKRPVKHIAGCHMTNSPVGQQRKVRIFYERIDELGPG
jgi:hypothetical protein